MRQVVHHVPVKDLPKAWQKDFSAEETVEVFISSKGTVTPDPKIERQKKEGAYTEFAADDLKGMMNWFDNVGAQ